MDVERLLQVAFLVSYLTLRELVHGKEKANCQQFKFVIDEDVIHDHILEGHVFKRLTVASAAKCHVICKDDCLCASMNYFPSSKGNNCELNNANKEMEPSGKHKCVNRCCRPNPCVNGGDCKEICNPEGKRFNCTCPATHTGQRCETKLARSCNDVAENNGNLTSGNYTIYDSTKKKFPVYCDMESEAEFVWTLIQSFSLGNKGTFDNKGFGVDFPKNDANSYVDWSAYRLSLPHMQYLANNSTHLRVTCNYPTEGLKYTDYARAKLEGHDIFGTWSSLCHHYEYINIRGNNCRDCTAGTKQTNGSVWSINSYSSKMKFGCDLDGRPGADGYENNFDVYYGGKIHPAYRCSSSPDSTTQHWFGALHNL